MARRDLLVQLRRLADDAERDSDGPAHAILRGAVTALELADEPTPRRIPRRSRLRPAPDPTTTPRR